MANTIRLKRGTTEPVAGNLVTGELAINTGDATVYTKLDDGTVTPIVGKSNNLFVSVRNESGSTIPAFSAVYINGASSNKPTIVLAQANSEATSSKTLGFTTAAISNGQNGEVIATGLLTKVDTQAYSAGASLWLSPTTPGGVTTTMPSAPNHAVFLGVVVTSANNGKIEVKVQNGYELQELHNVSITSPDAGDVLGYDSVNSLWKNLSGYATQSWVSSQGYLTSSSLTGYAQLSGATFTGGITLPSRALTGVAYLNLGSIANNLAAPASLVEGDIYFTDSDSSGGWNSRLNYTAKNFGGTLTQYSLAVLQNTNFFTQPQTISCSATASQSALRITNTGAGQSIVVEDETNPDTSAFVVNPSGFVGIQRDPATWTPAAGVALDVNGKGVFTPSATVAGINVGTVSATPTTLSNGDIWIGDQLNFRNRSGQDRQVAVLNTSNGFSGSTSVNPMISVTQTGNAGAVTIANSGTGAAIRITQTGTGASFVVEDNTSPDTSSFVIDASGNVGVGVSPTWTGTNKLEVQGSITTTTQSYTDTSLRAATTAFVKNIVAGSVLDLASDQSWALGYNGAPNHLIKITDNGANGSVIVPTGSGMPPGSQWVFIQQGGHSMTFQTDGNGAVLNSFTNQYTTAGDKAVVTLIYLGSDVWHLAGNLA